MCQPEAGQACSEGRSAGARRTARKHCSTKAWRVLKARLLDWMSLAEGLAALQERRLRAGSIGAAPAASGEAIVQPFLLAERHGRKTRYGNQTENLVAASLIYSFNFEHEVGLSHAGYNLTGAGNRGHLRVPFVDALEQSTLFVLKRQSQGHNHLQWHSAAVCPRPAGTGEQ